LLSTLLVTNIVAEILTRAGMPQALAELNEDSLAQKMVEIIQQPPVIDQQQLQSYGLQAICNQYLALKA